MTYTLLINDTQVATTAPVRQPPSRLGRRPRPRLPNGRVALDVLRRSYDGPASLSFRVGGDWRPGQGYHWAPDSVVELRKDKTTVVFKGLLDLPHPAARMNEYEVDYVAYDHSRVHRSAVSADGFPSIRLDTGRLGDVVSQFLSHVGATLTDIDVSSTALFSGGAERVQCLPLTIEVTVHGPAFDHNLIVALARV